MYRIVVYYKHTKEYNFMDITGSLYQAEEMMRIMGAEDSAKQLFKKTEKGTFILLKQVGQ